MNYTLIKMRFWKIYDFSTAKNRAFFTRLRKRCFFNRKNSENFYMFTKLRFVTAKKQSFFACLKKAFKFKGLQNHAQNFQFMQLRSYWNRRFTCSKTELWKMITFSTVTQSLQIFNLSRKNLWFFKIFKYPRHEREINYWF